MAVKDFEQSLKDLENIVKDLETGDLPIEQALKRFEEGMALSKRCGRILDETERKVSQLIQNNEGLVTEQDFGGNETDADG
jgi:exodeoxyribonuclease VII small subunit